MPSSSLWSRLLLAAGLLVVGACGSEQPRTSPTPTSRPPVPTSSVAADLAPTTTAPPTTAPTPTTEPAPRGPLEDAYATAMVQALVEEQAVADADQARCLSDAWVELLGLDRLRAAALTPEQFASGEGSQYVALVLTADEAGLMYDRYGECGIDLPGVYRGVAIGEAGEELAYEQVRCVEEALTDEHLRAAYAAYFVQQEPAFDPFAEADRCLVPQAPTTEEPPPSAGD